MKPFRFCPACGSRLEAPAGDGGARCLACGRSWYRNPAPTVGAVIVRDGAALVTRRALEPHKGRFDVPGGFLRVGEDPIEGLKREIGEELGVEIDVGVEDTLMFAPHLYGDEQDWNLSLGFAARIVSGQPAPADDVAAIRWVRIDEIDDLDWAWEHDRHMVRKALDAGPR